MITKYFLRDSIGQRHYQEAKPKRRLWLSAIVVLALIWAAVFASPNFFPDRFALQISPVRSSTILDNPFRDAVRGLLMDNNMTYEYAGRLRVGGTDTRVFEIRFYDHEERTRGRLLLNNFFEENYPNTFVMSYNQVKTAPRLIRLAGGTPLNLGLDLRGGVHFVMQVDIAQAVQQRISSAADEFRLILRQSRIRTVAFSAAEEVTRGEIIYPAIEMGFVSEKTRDDAIKVIAVNQNEMGYETSERGGIYYVLFYFTDLFIEEIRDFAITQNMATLRERINELGVTSPLVQSQGNNRIVVEIPGVQDAAAAKRIIGSTANLEFRLEAAARGAGGSAAFPFRDNPREKAFLHRQIIVGGTNVINAQAQFDPTGLPEVAISLDTQGGRKMNRATRDSVGKRMAVVLIESRVLNFAKDEETGETEFETERRSEIISFPVIRDVLGSRFVITGLYNQAEASELALLLRAGALAAPMYFVEERTIGASLGQDNINRGIFSLLAGSLAVILFIIFYYRVFGIVANLGLLFNMVLIIAIMSQLGAALTLPGIAGIVLTVGMAIDANILIFSRIKEEIKRGLTGILAIDAGYNRAFLSIIDANLTTLLVGIVLFAIGTGPIKGFAVTLSIGILTSLFTSIIFTRRILDFLYGRRILTKLYL